MLANNSKSFILRTRSITGRPTKSPEIWSFWPITLVWSRSVPSQNGAGMLRLLVQSQ